MQGDLLLVIIVGVSFCGVCLLAGGLYFLHDKMKHFEDDLRQAFGPEDDEANAGLDVAADKDAWRRNLL